MRYCWTFCRIPLNLNGVPPNGVPPKNGVLKNTHVAHVCVCASLGFPHRYSTFIVFVCTVSIKRTSTHTRLLESFVISSISYAFKCSNFWNCNLHMLSNFEPGGYLFSIFLARPCKTIDFVNGTNIIERGPLCIELCCFQVSHFSFFEINIPMVCRRLSWDDNPSPG